jgi:Arc/MetJ-type ribon-helix-helix transcriptional regulator
MTLELELPEHISQRMTEQLRGSEFKSAESLALAAIVQYLDDKAERAHLQMLLDEAEASGPYVEFTLDELKVELDNIFSEAKADLIRQGVTIRE